MKHSKSSKITFGHNVIKKESSTPNDFIAEEDQSIKSTSGTNKKNKFNAIELEKWMQLWSRTPHNPYSNNGCDE